MAVSDIYPPWPNFLSLQPSHRTYLLCIHLITQKHTHIACLLTPADAQVDFEVVSLGEHGDDQEVVEVDAFHQQPVAVGHDTVLHHHEGDAAADHRLQSNGEV